MNAADTSRGRVLIVDDERSVLDSYARWLIKAGFEVAEASGGAEALQRIESDQFDVVLSDISMPEIDGFALLRRVRARSVDLPVILMLDTLNNRTAIQAVELGALQYLVKPIDPEALEEMAAYAARLHRSRRATLAAFRNRRGEQVNASSFTATDAKKEFGRVLEMVIQGGVVVITKHDAPKAVLLSVDEFNALARATGRKLDTLSGEFDALLARMQTPRARAGMKAAFEASPKQLGKAAVAAARKRG
jgi:prevent-host-death family protein